MLNEKKMLIARVNYFVLIINHVFEIKLITLVF